MSRKSDSHLDFDLDAVKRQSMDNPVYYVQYAHARIRSLLRKAEEQNVELPEPSAARMECLDTAEDKALLDNSDPSSQAFFMVLVHNAADGEFEDSGNENGRYSEKHAWPSIPKRPLSLPPPRLKGLWPRMNSMA